jgi:multiple sugar transport system substrate-binding protein
MELWLEKVGELPARRAVAERDAVRTHPKYGAFIRGLTYSQATFFVNETAQRKLFMDMVDRIVLKGQAPAESVAQTAAEEQKLLDGFFGK